MIEQVLPSQIKSPSYCRYVCRLSHTQSKLDVTDVTRTFDEQ